MSWKDARGVIARDLNGGSIRQYLYVYTVHMESRLEFLEEGIWKLPGLMRVRWGDGMGYIAYVGLVFAYGYEVRCGGCGAESVRT